MSRFSERARLFGKFLAVIGVALVGIAVLTGTLVGIAVLSIHKNVGPLASRKVEIGNEKRPLAVTLHELCAAWDYEHGLMLKPAPSAPRPRLSLKEVATKRVVSTLATKKVEAEYRWMPETWQQSLVSTIQSAHLRTGYFAPVAAPVQPTSAALAIRD